MVLRCANVRVPRALSHLRLAVAIPTVPRSAHQGGPPRARTAIHSHVHSVPSCQGVSRGCVGTSTSSVPHSGTTPSVSFPFPRVANVHLRLPRLSRRRTRSRWSRDRAGACSRVRTGTCASCDRSPLFPNFAVPSRRNGWCGSRPLPPVSTRTTSDRMRLTTRCPVCGPQAAKLSRLSLLLAT